MCSARSSGRYVQSHLSQSRRFSVFCILYFTIYKYRHAICIYLYGWIEFLFPCNVPAVRSTIRRTGTKNTRRAFVLTIASRKLQRLELRCTCDDFFGPCHCSTSQAWRSEPWIPRTFSLPPLTLLSVFLGCFCQIVGAVAVWCAGFYIWRIFRARTSGSWSWLSGCFSRSCRRIFCRPSTPSLPRTRYIYCTFFVRC